MVPTLAEPSFLPPNARGMEVRKTLRNKRTRRAVYYSLLGVALITLAVAVVYAQGSSRPHPATGGKPVSRLVVIAIGAFPSVPKVTERDCLRSSQCQNGLGGTVLVQLVNGTAPVGTQIATVLTDQNCTPDQQGISHCLNKVEMANGSTLVVRDNHNMMNNPCLGPGERIRVEPMALFLRS